MENVREMIGIYDTDSNEKLRVPVDLLQLFADVLRPFDDAEKDGTDGGGGSWIASDVVPSFKTGVFHEHVAWAFVKALKDGSPMPVTIEDALRAFAMIEAAYKAAASWRAEPVAVLED